MEYKLMVKGLYHDFSDFQQMFHEWQEVGGKMYRLTMGGYVQVAP